MYFFDALLLIFGALRRLCVPNPKKKYLKKTEFHPLTLPASEYLILTHFWLKFEASHTQNKNEKNKKGVYHKIMCKKYLKKYPGIKNGLQSNKNNTISAIATTTPTIVLNTQYSDHSRIIVHSTTADSGVLTC